MDASIKKLIVNGILIAMACVLLGVGGWYGYQEYQFKYFKDRKEGFAIKYPRGWQLVTNPQPGVIAIFISPKENALDTFQENVNISMTNLAANPKTMPEYVKETEEQMAMIFSDLVVSESIPYKMGTHDGHKFVFTGSGDPTSTLVVYAFLYHNVAYNVTYLGDPERYNLKDKLVFEKMMKSLKILF